MRLLIVLRVFLKCLGLGVNHGTAVEYSSQAENIDLIPVVIQASLILADTSGMRCKHD
jgi:hypothetical protein